MAQYKRKLSGGLKWYFRGQFKKRSYCSKAIYQTKTEAKTAEINFLKTFKAEKPKKDSLLEICNQRLDYIQTSKSHAYYRANRDLFARILALWGKNLPIESVSRPMVHKFLLSEAERLKKANRGFYSVNSDLRLMRALFNFAINELDILEVNPTRKLKFWSIDQRLKYIPPEDHIKLVESNLNIEQLNLFIFLKESGARISEALRFTPKDIDEAMNQLTLWTRKKRHSNLTYRKIPLSPEISGRKPFNYSQRPRFLDRICRDLDIPIFGYHSLRHRYAHNLALQNTPLVVIMNYLGHESATTTQIYLRSLGHINY